MAKGGYGRPVSGYPSLKAAVLALHAEGLHEPEIALRLDVAVGSVRARIYEAGRAPNAPRQRSPRAAPAVDDRKSIPETASHPGRTDMLDDDRLVQINCRVPPKVAERLGQMAANAKMPTGTYAATLLVAAYSARVKPPTGDRDLDAAVARVAILSAEDRDTAEIAGAVGLSEATVCRVLAAWRDEVGLRRAA